MGSFLPRCDLTQICLHSPTPLPNSDLAPPLPATIAPPRHCTGPRPPRLPSTILICSTSLNARRRPDPLPPHISELGRGGAERRKVATQRDRVRVRGIRKTRRLRERHRSTRPDLHYLAIWRPPNSPPRDHREMA
uniref:Uncharacterized protein n=1 Tax=Arundo donax TaxID=35708 RepID=A0A0A9DDH4_ARUDO